SVGALPAGAGAEFKPDRPFTAGETVRVIAGLTSRRAGTASGAPGATRLSFSFRVAQLVRPEVQDTARVPAAGLDQTGGWMSATASRRTQSDTGPTQSFHSEPALHPPVVNVTSDPDPKS